MQSCAAGENKNYINRQSRKKFKKVTEKNEHIVDPEEINRLNRKFEKKWCRFKRNDTYGRPFPISQSHEIYDRFRELANAALQYYNNGHDTSYTFFSIMDDGVESIINSTDEQIFVISFKAIWCLERQYTFKAKVFVCRPYGNLKVKYCDLIGPKPCCCRCHSDPYSHSYNYKSLIEEM